MKAKIAIYNDKKEVKEVLPLCEKLQKWIPSFLRKMECKSEVKEGKTYFILEPMKVRKSLVDKATEALLECWDKDQLDFLTLFVGQIQKEKYTCFRLVEADEVLVVGTVPVPEKENLEKAA